MTRNILTAVLLLLATIWSAAQERYQHYGTVTSFGGAQVSGTGVQGTVIVGEPAIGPFSGGVYQGYAGFLHMESACEVPEGLNVTNITASGADVDWITHATALNYKVRYRLEGNAEWLEQDVVAGPVSLAGLQSGMPYRVQVRSLCSVDEFRKSLWSDVLVFETTGATACVAPIDIVVANITATGADIAWTGDAGAADYIVKYKSNAEAEWVITNTGSAAASMSLSGLTGGQEYQIGIQADCAGDGSFLSQNSNFMSFTTVGALSCPPVTGISPAVVSDTQIDLTWGAVAEATNGYAVYYKQQSSAAWLPAYEGTVLSYSFVDLAPGTNYDFRVMSMCSANEQTNSETVSAETTGTFSCDAITAIIEDSNTDDGSDATLVLSWATPTNAVGYKVRYRRQGSIEYTYEEVASAQVTLPDLYMVYPYQIAVRTICSADGATMSAWSETFTITTSGSLSCETPNTSTAIPDGVNTDQVTISWNEVALTYEYYQIQYKVKGTSVWQSEDAGSNSITLTGLEPGLTYEYRLRSMCDSALNFASAWGSIAEFTLQGASACEIPTGLSAPTIESDNTVITWNSVSPALTYTLRYRQSGTAAWSYLETATASATLADYAQSNYEFQVRSNCDLAGTVISDYSASLYIDMISSSTCDELTDGIALISNTETSLEVGWMLTSGSYELEYKVSSANVYTSVNVDGAENYIITGLVAGTDYNIRVRAYCEAGDIYSGYTEGVFTTVGLPYCSVPTSVVVSDITDTGFKMAWLGVLNAGEEFGINMKQGQGAWQTSYTANNDITFSGLEPGAEHLVYVWKKCLGQLTSENTDLVYVSTTGTPSCADVPGDLLLTAITSTSATISWTGVGTAGDQYHIQYKEDGTFTWTEGDFAWQNQHLLTGLFDGTTYLFRVRKLCSAGQFSAFSYVMFFSTPIQGAGARTMEYDEELNETLATVDEVAVYPNPFDQMVTISYQLSDEQHMAVDITDMTGHQVRSVLSENQAKGQYDLTVDLSDLPDGVYIVRFVFGEQKLVYKQIVKN